MTIFSAPLSTDVLTVIIAASDDPYAPPRNSAALHKRLPNSVPYAIEDDHMFSKNQSTEIVILLKKISVIYNNGAVDNFSINTVTLPS